MGSGFSKMKKQARAMQQEFAKMKEEAQSTRITGSAGNDLVNITMNGDKEILEFKINPECVDPEDIEGLQDLLLAAYKDAAAQADAKSPENALGGAFPGLGF